MSSPAEIAAKYATYSTNGWAPDQLGDAWEPPTSAPAQENHKRTGEKSQPAVISPFQFYWNPTDSTAFASNVYSQSWIIQDVMVCHQPGVICGPAKTLKTNIAVDLAISAASCTPFLNRWKVAQHFRVAVLSCESGPKVLQETAQRICEARGITLAELGDRLLWQFTLPQFANKDQLDLLRIGLEKAKVQLALFDPLYLSLLNGSDLSASNLFQIGPLLLQVAQVCLSIGVTPIVIHHSPKPIAKKYEPLDLSDMAYAGISEFARQWILLSRREAYESGSGRHPLWMQIGGSSGHSGCFAVDIDEGQLNDQFGGRRWDVSVQFASSMRAEEKKSKADAKEQEKTVRQKSDEAAVLAALNQLSPEREPVAYGRCRSLSGLTKDRMATAFERLKASKHVLESTVKIKIGSGAERDSLAIQRAKE